MMNSKRANRLIAWLLAGDIVTLGLVTLFGFASHDLLNTAASRILTTFIPLLISWLLIAPFLGNYDLGRMLRPVNLWRPFYAMVLAGPMAGFLRGVMLGNAPVLPVFVVVLGGISALALLAWRTLFWFLVLRKQPL